MLICRQAELSQDHVVRIVAIMVVTAVLVNEELLLKRYPKGSAPEAEAEGAEERKADDGDDADHVFVSGRDCQHFTLVLTLTSTFR